MTVPTTVPKIRIDSLTPSFMASTVRPYFDGPYRHTVIARPWVFCYDKTKFISPCCQYQPQIALLLHAVFWRTMPSLHSPDSISSIRLWFWPTPLKCLLCIWSFIGGVHECRHNKNADTCTLESTHTNTHAYTHTHTYTHMHTRHTHARTHTHTCRTSQMTPWTILTSLWPSTRGWQQTWRMAWA